MKKKRGQMEIMGLAIIVVLISLIILIVYKFVLSVPPSETREGFIQTETAANFLSALVKSHTECKDTKVIELFQDCALHRGAGGTIDCGSGVFSCDYLYKSGTPNTGIIVDILAETIDKWNKPYTLSVKYSANPKTISRPDSPPEKICKEDNIGVYGGYENLESKQSKIPLGGSEVLIVQLDLCS